MTKTKPKRFTLTKETKGKLVKDKRAVSSDIAEILMVAIVVILAAVIGAFMFGIIPTVEKTPSALLLINVDSTNLELKHRGGDPVDLSDCIVRVKGAEVTGFDEILTVEESETEAHGETINAGDVVAVEIIHTPSQSYLLDTKVTAGA